MAEKEEAKLLECPFCGNTRIMHMRGDVGSLHWGFCSTCKAEGPVAMSWDEAKGLWNTRRGKPGCDNWDAEEQECMD